MLRNRFLGELSWLALRDADKGSGSGQSDQDGAGGGDAGKGADDAGGDKGDKGGADGAGGDAAGAPDKGSAGAGADAGGAGQGADGGAPAAGAGAKPDADSDWRDKELARRARRLREEAERREAADRENAGLREMLERLAAANGDGAAGTGDGTGGAPRTYTQADLEREATRRATDLLQQERLKDQTAEFNRQCNAAVLKGRGEFGQDKFDAAMTQLGNVGFYGDDPQRPDMTNLNMILQTDDPQRVMYELGQNPNEFYRLMDLPPGRRQVEFVKMSLKAAPAGGGQQQQQRRPSGASPPVDPIRGGGGEGDNRYSDEAPASDWHAQEDKREKEYYARKNASLRG